MANIISNINFLGLVGGLALFLFGMNIMGNALEKSAGSKLKNILAGMTSNLFKGFFLGFVVTAVIQSSSATTVMVVGFVNSGIMTLRQAVGIIMGANLGTSVTAWILSLAGIEKGAWYVTMFKPDSFVPVLAAIGIIMFMVMKKQKYKDIGTILLGFATLMYGMEFMSDSVSKLSEVEEFAEVFAMFENPILGVIAGAVLTAIIQSSSASVGILQALSTTKGITYAAALPIIMGQNIGTCVTALISCIGASKNARRAAVLHLLFNVMGTVIILPIFFVLSLVVEPVTEFAGLNATPFGIAVCHSVFNVAATAALLPLNKLLVRLAELFVRDNPEKDGEIQLLDERLLATPTVAIGRCKTVTVSMAEVAVKSLHDSVSLLDKYDEKLYARIREDENKVDMYEDKLGSYLVKLTAQDLSEADSHEANKLLHVIGDFERISDHALNIAASAEEIREKGLEFSGEAKKELSVLMEAINEILDITQKSFAEDDLDSAITVEPLEQVVDKLKDILRARHIQRLRRQECTIELGFILTDILTNFERVSDHCSNIAACMLEIAHDEFDVHEYLRRVKGGNEEEFNRYFEYYSMKYSLSEQ